MKNRYRLLVLLAIALLVFYAGVATQQMHAKVEFDDHIEAFYYGFHAGCFLGAVNMTGLAYAPYTENFMGTCYEIADEAYEGWHAEPLLIDKLSVWVRYWNDGEPSLDNLRIEVPAPK